MAAGFLLACSGGTGRGRMPDQPGGGGELAEEDRFVPGYGKPELQKALISERAAEATAERVAGELQITGDDRYRIVIGDLAVRRRFIVALEACESTGRDCPPRLDDPPWAFDLEAEPPLDPPMTATLRFDLDSWRVLATELHGRACACRTIYCLDSTMVAIDQLEKRPMPDVLGDDAATLSITRARECLFRLRGKQRARRPQET
jgi:hypothetical protein